MDVLRVVFQMPPNAFMQEYCSKTVSITNHKQGGIVWICSATSELLLASKKIIDIRVFTYVVDEPDHMELPQGTMPKTNNAEAIRSWWSIYSVLSIQIAFVGQRICDAINLQP